MNTSILSDEEFIPEHIVQQVVEKAKRLYDTKESRLQYAAMVFGKDKISDPDCFYHHYFERDD